jgi:hypothetical protein
MILKPMDEELYNNTTELQKKDIGLAGILNEDSFSDVNINIYKGI